MDLGVVHNGRARGKSLPEPIEFASANMQQVKHVMKALLSELDILMNVAGFQSIDQIDSSALGKFLISKQ